MRLWIHCFLLQEEIVLEFNHCLPLVKVSFPSVILKGLNKDFGDVDNGKHEDPELHAVTGLELEIESCSIRIY